MEEIQKINLLRYLLASRQSWRGLSDFAKHELYDDAGKLSTILLVYHPYMLHDWTTKPPASSWSVGLVFDVGQDSVVGVLDGLLPCPDKARILKSLDDNALMLAHPFSIFYAILEVHVKFSQEGVAKIFIGLYNLELEFGLATRGETERNEDPWSINQDGFRTCIGTSAKLENHAIYLRKQINNLVIFKGFLLDLNQSLSHMAESRESSRHGPAVKTDRRSYRIMTTNLNNLGNTLSSLQDYMDFLSKRIGTCSFFLTTLMNYKEAKDSSYNSSIASSIALTTMTFLPATAVATIFSMGVMNADGNGTLALSASFWVYWAVTLPLTATTMLSWYAWVKIRPRLRSGENRRSATVFGSGDLPKTTPNNDTSRPWSRKRKMMQHHCTDDESHLPDMPSVG
ncbi:hypothetical protein MMC13_001663 [Lambiella insularis]|nr:hypothetical protein [Lambiella insularis]